MEENWPSTIKQKHAHDLKIDRGWEAGTGPNVQWTTTQSSCITTHQTPDPTPASHPPPTTHYHTGVSQSKSEWTSLSPSFPSSPLYLLYNYQEPPTMEEFQSFFMIYLLKDKTCFFPEMLLPRPIQKSFRAILYMKYYVMLICYTVPMIMRWKPLGSSLPARSRVCNFFCCQVPCSKNFRLCRQ